MRNLLFVLLCALVLLAGCAQEDSESGQDPLRLEARPILELLEKNPAGNITEEEVGALREALARAYEDLAAYRQATRAFGERQPFAAAVQNEEDHVVALLRLHEKYDLPLIDEGPSPAIPGSFVAACEDAAERERQEIDFYADLVGRARNDDVVLVLTSMRDLSRDHHLPAFAACGRR